MKDFLKHCFQQTEKKLEGSLKNREKLVSTSHKINCAIEIISSFFENCFSPKSNNGFHSQKNSPDQKTLFSLDRKSVFTSRMKYMLKNAFPLYGKVASTFKNLGIFLKISKKNWCLPGGTYIFCLLKLTSPKL